MLRKQLVISDKPQQSVGADPRSPATGTAFTIAPLVRELPVPRRSRVSVFTLPAMTDAKKTTPVISDKP